MEIVSRGPVPILNTEHDASTTSRGAWFSDVLGPLDRLPGLHVGQRWEIAGRQPVHRPGRARAGRGGAADRDPLGRQSRQPTSRSSRQIVQPADADLGPTRRRHPAAGGAIPVRAAGPGASPRGQSRATGAEPSRTAGRPGHDRGPGRDEAVRNQVRRRSARPRGPGRRALRLPRAQRRRQDDDDQDDLRAARARRRAPCGSAASRRPASRPGNCSVTSPTSPISTTS